MIRRFSSFFVLVLLIVSFASSAAAQGIGEAQAEALFQEGQRLMGAKQYDQACEKFADSLRIDPSTGTLLNLASCREKQGRLATAWAMYSKAASQARLAGQNDRETFAQSKVNDLGPKLSRLTLTLDPSQDRTGLSITLDGEPVTDTAFGFPIPVDAGKHLIVAKKPGNQDWSAEVTVRPSAASESVLIPVLGVAGSSPVAASVPAPPGAAPENAAQVARLETELEQLREERSDIGIGGPITMLAIGGGVAIVGVLVLYGALTASQLDLSGEPDGGALAVGGVSIAAGAGLALGGGLFLASRLRQRRALDPQIEQKVEQLQGLGVEVSGIGFNPRLGTVVVSGTF